MARLGALDPLPAQSSTRVVARPLGREALKGEPDGKLHLLGEGVRDEALLVGRGRAPVGRLQPGQFDIVDERAEKEAGVAVGTEAAIAQMLLERFGRPRHQLPARDLGGRRFVTDRLAPSRT